MKHFTDALFEEYIQESANFEELNIGSPEELMDWMNDNITYELVDDEYSNSNGVPTKTAEEVLETKTGHCAEQSYLEKEILDNLGYESFLVMVKENNSKKEYGAEGSAHVFLVYKDEKDNYCWFEHSMQHARGIHKYTNLDALLQDVANQWWRYDENSDILEVRFMDKYITGVDNWGLAKECYKYPVKYTFDISNNIMESDVPLEEALTEGIWSYQTWTRTGPRNKPIYTLTYGENTVAKYDKNTFEFALGADWERHTDKLIDWLNEYYPGFFTKRESPDSASYRRFYPTKEEAIAYIKNKKIPTV